WRPPAAGACAVQPRSGTRQHSSCCVSAAQLRVDVLALPREGAGCEDAKSAALCCSLPPHELTLWPFVYNEGVEPINKTSEVVLALPYSPCPVATGMTLPPTRMEMRPCSSAPYNLSTDGRPISKPCPAVRSMVAPPK